MNARDLRSLDDRTGIGLRLEPRDIFLDRCVEQCHVLREVADKLAEIAVGPLRQFGIVEPDAATQCRPDAGERPCQCCLSPAAWPNDPQGLAGLDLKTDLADENTARSGRGDSDLLHFQGIDGWGQKQW